MGVNNIGWCGANTKHEKLAREIRALYPALTESAKITNSQLEEATCRLERAREIAQMAEGIEAANIKCLNSLTEKGLARIRRYADVTRKQNLIAFLNAKISDQQLEEATCQWEDENRRIRPNEKRK